MKSYKQIIECIAREQNRKIRVSLRKQLPYQWKIVLFSKSHHDIIIYRKSGKIVISSILGGRTIILPTNEMTIRKELSVHL